MIGNGRISFPVLATVFYGVITMPENWNSMMTAYKKGRKSASIHHWVWNDVVSEQTEHLKKNILLIH